MNIYDALKQDHRTVKKLFRSIEKQEQPDSGFLSSTFEHIQKELDAHMQSEEKIFYAPLLENDISKQDALKAIEEHNIARQIIKDITGVPEDDLEHRIAKIDVLREVVEEHIDEEESTLFSDAREVFDRKKANELAATFETEKNGIKEPAMSGR